MKQKIVFFGSGEYNIATVERLREFDLILVVTSEKEGTFLEFLKKEKIPYLISRLNHKSSILHLKPLHPTVGVLASYGALVPEEIIKLFPHGILNIHPSLLPKYKGPSPIQETILAGETETGVTIIRLDSQLDHGPILAQEKVRLVGDETTQALKRALFHIGSLLVEMLLTKLELGKKLPKTHQDHTKEVFTKKITKIDGFIDINNPPTPEKLDRMIRAYYPWPGVWLKVRIMNKELRIKLLPSKQLQVEGKKPMSYKEFVNGYQKDGKELLEKINLL